MNKKVIIGCLLALSATFNAHAQLTPDDIAKTLAGMNPHVPTKGVYTDWTANEPNSRLNDQQQRLIREFSQHSLTAANRDTKVVFYPFGGPDVIFPSLFFPNMKTLILAGLEAPGTLPVDLNMGEAAVKIRDVRQAYKELFKRGYYITSAMSHELQQFGTTTMISVGLALLGNTVSGVEYGPRAVKIKYVTPAGESRRVFYFQRDLSDKNISQDFIDLVKRARINTTFYKASSYVPHMSGFSKVNALALEGRYFVQSDTGLRISDFAQSGGWEVHLFGQYVTPHSQFGVRVQNELKTAYGAAICRSENATAYRQYLAIWPGVDPCRLGATPESAISVYEGPLSFPYDYAGKLSPGYLRGFSSSLMYAVRKN